MITLSGEDPIVLPPGDYWIELDFDRPVTRETLLEAMRAMGFARVVLEPVSVNGRVGALGSLSAVRTAAPTTTTSASSLTKTSAVSTASAPAPVPSTATVSAPSAVSRATAPAPIASPTAPSTVTRAVAPAPPPAMPSPSAPSAVTRAASPAPAPVNPAASLPQRSPSIAIREPARAAAYASSAAPAIPPRGQGLGGMGPGASAAAPSATSSPSLADAGYDEGSAAPGAAATSSTPQPSGGGGADFPDDLATSEASTAAPSGDYGTPTEAVAAPAAVEAPATKTTSLLPWALAAAGAAVAAVAVFAGEGEPEIEHENPYAFRITARLARPIAARNLPGMWWRSIHRLSIDPTEAMPYTMTPHRLIRGVTYDLRFLARDRSSLARRAVVELMTTMGFVPADALLVRRNVRIPGRPGTSLSEWLGVGTWNGPDTYTTIEDPLLFVGVSPVEGASS